jgi:hypothetical protein
MNDPQLVVPAVLGMGTFFLEGILVSRVLTYLSGETNPMGFVWTIIFLLFCWMIGEPAFAWIYEAAWKSGGIDCIPLLDFMPGRGQSAYLLATISALAGIAVARTFTVPVIADETEDAPATNAVQQVPKQSGA